MNPRKWLIALFLFTTCLICTGHHLFALRAAKTPLATPRLLRFLSTFPDGEQLYMRSYLAFDCTHDYLGAVSANGEEFYFISEDGNERKGVLLFEKKEGKVQFRHYCSFCYVYRDLPRIGLNTEELRCVATFWAKKELEEKGEEQLKVEALSLKNKIYPLQKEIYEQLGILP
ncbi:hypothetical protein [Methylacidiphilum caldifontis]|uniref:Uncharacterized protein n=1 Tax=Methylacidiphilum caldifontis TaxID=2795386 RepID=A0A4Y8P8V9_9BACT|nr:hypothetical protein [Methylacidiphilum caldifontis]QSR89409.1 hypothetical protein IT6_03775 [Methylacidiphilum caldifontis]TFE67001.1 hypothetical protein A7Q10_01740 [Methylacidiphilum caldifontis]